MKTVMITYQDGGVMILTGVRRINLLEFEGWSDLQVQSDNWFLTLSTGRIKSVNVRSNGGPK